MKKIATFLIPLILLTFTLYSQQTYTVTASGNSFNPATLEIHVGDIVQFNTGSSHPVLQVSQSTWNANGTTPLAGGFSFPNGSGSFTANSTGTIYYVCTSHVGDGMKGTITVSLATSIHDNYSDNHTRLYPVPAKDYLFYSTDDRSPSFDVKIIDLTGKPVIVMNMVNQVTEDLMINVSGLHKGFYIIIIKTEKRSYIRKFLKS